MRDVNAVLDALAGHQFDRAVDFLSFDEKDATDAVRLWTGRTGQYIQISSVSIYHKPVRRVPFTESTPGHNHCPPIAYLRRCPPAAAGRLAGLVANYQAVGEDFHITSGEALPWDEIYRTIAAAAGTECR